MTDIEKGATQQRAGRPGDILAKPILSQLPRLLTQIDRNPHSPTYGSCCRNFWHYRIEDISNSQFQNLVLTLAYAWLYDSSDNPYRGTSELLSWIEAIIGYTTRLQRPSGSFDEVYRGQDSYAATAFVLFSVSETLLLLDDKLDPVVVDQAREMMVRSAHWLAGTDETFSANQIAAAAMVFHNVDVLTSQTTFHNAREKALGWVARMQTDEGWFSEYGGADIGYGTLTQSFLALLHERSGNEHAREMAERSLEFLKHFLHPDGTVGGEYGSRNTAYLIPFGLPLMASASPTASNMWQYLSLHLADGNHDVVAGGLDDRYLAYLSPYFMLAADFANRLDPGLSSGETPVPPIAPSGEVYFPEAKLWVYRNDCFQVIVSLAKGSLFRCDFPDRTWLDSGFFGTTEDGASFTSQHLNKDTSVRVENGRAVIKTDIRRRKPILITPWKNILIRCFNMLMPAGLRRGFLTLLRHRAVSAGRPIGHLKRTIVVKFNAIHIEDIVRFDTPVTEVDLQMGKERAFSFASTGFFQPQELNTGWREAPHIRLASTRRVQIDRIITADDMTCTFSTEAPDTDPGTKDDAI